MINEDKVKLMTRIQLFEDSEKEALRASRFYLADYLLLHLIESLLAFTVIFAIITGILILYNLETILTSYNLDMLMSTGKEIGLYYAALLVPTLILSMVIYWFHYRRCRKKVRGHIGRLRQLENFYQRTESQKTENRN